ncbi:hypothetical protein UA08_08877 [Talaromyces atroroseus]|uniref:Uncharacterized protein n=1 Tax=Talaromyces atroroseus TaxID=1441469 RepID=A0A225A5S1_TALAT|nr:hypothetical protein UA08_08877 [Talaromyces atroroseus]OKL55791.1 hypothetical protein UA08_08877 [Talaromyces atroroseus]
MPNRYIDKQTQTDDIISEIRDMIQDEQNIQANRQNSKHKQTLDTINETDCPGGDSEPDSAAISSLQNVNQPETLSTIDDTHDIDVQTEQGNTGDDKSSD